MLTKSIAGLAVTVLGFATLTACGSEEKGASVATDGACAGVNVKKIGYSPLTAKFDYFQFTIQGMKQAAKKCGAEIVVDDPDSNAGKQVSGIENMLTAGVDAVGIVSVDPEAIQAAVDEAKSQDVTVISQVSTFKGADVYVGLPESEFGRLQGSAAGAALKELKPDKDEYQIAILNADSLGSGLLERKSGLTDGLEESVTNYKVVADVEAYTEEDALSAVENILQAHPDVDLILTVNDPGSLGALAAVKATGLTPNDDVMVGGLGIDKRVLEGVLNGDFPQSVSPEPLATGEAIVQAAFDISAGRKPTSNVQVPPVLITTENAQKYLDELYPDN